MNDPANTAPAAGTLAWNANLYNSKRDFVWKFSSDVAAFCMRRLASAFWTLAAGPAPWRVKHIQNLNSRLWTRES